MEEGGKSREDERMQERGRKARRRRGVESRVEKRGHFSGFQSERERHRRYADGTLTVRVLRDYV